MNKYVLCHYSIKHNNYDTEKIWCLCKVYARKRKVPKNYKVYEFKIRKFLKASSNFDKLYSNDGIDYNSAYIPHIKKDGNLYIHVWLDDSDNINYRKDEVLDFENDEDAILYAELGGSDK